MPNITPAARNSRWASAVRDVFKVHPVDPDQQAQWHEDHRDDSQHLHDLVEVVGVQADIPSTRSPITFAQPARLWKRSINAWMSSIRRASAVWSRCQVVAQTPISVGVVSGILTHLVQRGVVTDQFPSAGHRVIRTAGLHDLVESMLQIQRDLAVAIGDPASQR